jgi:uncharacterized protein YecT (DUF1311 family)
VYYSTCSKIQQERKMDQKPSSKQTIIISVLSGALILGITGFFYYQDNAQPKDASQSTVANAIKTPKNPERNTAMQDLFGVTDPSGEVKTGEEALTSFWFEQSFTQGTDNFHVIFFKTQAIDEDGDPYQSHAQGVDVGAITYKQVGDEWQIIGKQPKFGEAGSWGDVPETTAEILPLSASVLAFMVDSSYSGQGYVDEGKMLFTFSKNIWHDIGYLQTGGDNSGDCDDESKSLEGLGACWSYEGKISVITGKNTDYPNLLVTRTGTESGANRNAVVPAKNVTYIFNGEKYINPADIQTTPASATIEQPLDNTDSTDNQPPLDKQQAKNELDEANQRLNSVWNATDKKTRAMLLPEQRQWLKQRESECKKQAASEQPDDKNQQIAIKLHCMAVMTDPRTEELKERIAAIVQN